MVIFWVVITCGLVGGYQFSEEHTASAFRVKCVDCGTDHKEGGY
jgi:hypothetical protein